MSLSGLVILCAFKKHMNEAGGKQGSGAYPHVAKVESEPPKKQTNRQESQVLAVPTCTLATRFRWTTWANSTASQTISAWHIDRQCFRRRLRWRIVTRYPHRVQLHCSTAEENWQERLSQWHTPAQILTYMKFLPWSSTLTCLMCNFRSCLRKSVLQFLVTLNKG